ncbi:hypothetical protein OC842_000252 [Tilletia horrida]|uniref:Uncharacterized protein n=1 Tax=Tilletia horrida TaxID=155126 RepID=A0AAN6JNM0_9BASI|nr:hypothetical protein OC842_000252 [Tilletia horrida]
MADGSSQQPTQEREDDLAKMSPPAPPPPGAIVLGLERITSLLARLRNPHANFPVIHVAGTNAKGSTTAYMDALLSRTVGLRTGRFNSPHLVTERDTCSLGGGDEIISPDVWKQASALVAAADQQDKPLDCTPFELLTATAFQSFDLLQPPSRPEVLLIEVGLGGKLDATNVFPPTNVLASVICPVDLDHESLLGSTLQEIATAKAGIIKAGGLCVLADQRRPVSVAQAGSKPSSSLDIQTDDAALRASTAVTNLEAEVSVLGQPAGIIVDTVAKFCSDPLPSNAEPSTHVQSVRLVRACAPLQALAPDEPQQAKPSASNPWQVRVPVKITLAPTLCTPTAAIQRYDDEDDFAEGGLGRAVKATLSQLSNAQFVPDPAIHPEAYDEDAEKEQTPIGSSAAIALLEQSPSHSLTLPATRAALSAASTALTTLHAIARDLPTLTPGSAQRELHSFDPWEELRLRIAYGLSAAETDDATPGSQIRAVLETGVRWRGRCEWVRLEAPTEDDSAQGARLDTVLLDGAHNPSSAQALREYLDASIKARFSAWLAATPGSSDSVSSSAAKLPTVEVTWLMAFSKGKDVRGMLETLLFAPQTGDSEPTDLARRVSGLTLTAPTQQPGAPVSIKQRIGLCPFATPVEGMPWVRPTETADVAEVVRELLPPDTQGTAVKELTSLEEALRWAAEAGGADEAGEVLRVTVICGSLYLVGECYGLAERVGPARFALLVLTSTELMETWTHHLKQGLDKVPRLSRDAASVSALLLYPSPSRWDWRQRATSRILARQAQHPPSSSSLVRRSTAAPARAHNSNHSSGPGSSSQLNLQSAAAVSSISAWADFGKVIPAQLRQLPRRVTPSQNLLLGAGASNALPATVSLEVNKRTRRRARKTSTAASTAGTKGKGKAKATEPTEAEPEYLEVRDEQLAALLAQHHAERTEVLLPAIRAYAARLSALLDHERDARRRELDARQARPVAKLVEQGMAIDGLQAYWLGPDQATAPSTSRRKKAAAGADANAPSSTKRMAIFKLPAGRLMEWNRFKVGDKVELRHGTGALFLDAFESKEGAGSGFGLTESQLAAVGTAAPASSAAAAAPSDNAAGAGLLAPDARPFGVIIEKTQFRLRVMFDLAKFVPTAAPSSSVPLLHPSGRPINLATDLENCTSWRLDLGENDAAENRMREALRALEHDIDVLERISLQPATSDTPERRGHPSSSAQPPSDDLEEAWIRSMTTPEFTAAIQRTEYVLSGCKVLDALLNVPSPSLRRLQEAASGKKGRGRPRTRPATTFDADCRIRSWAKRYDRDDPIVIDGDPDLGGLNASQTRAVAMMLRNRVSLVQGPPGTGKTKTIVETIRLLKQHFEVPQPILLTAHTNVAVDNLAEGCRRAGLRVVRAGSSPKAAGGAAADLLQAEGKAGPAQGIAGQPAGNAGRPELAECTLDYLMSRHPGKADLDTLTGRLMAARVRLGEIYVALENAGKSVSMVTDTGEFASLEEDMVLPIMPSDSSHKNNGSQTSTRIPKPDELAIARKQVARLAQRVFLQTQVMLSHILHSADVVCTTALSASSTSLRSIDFPVVFFDEGSMATEPVALVPLMKGCEHLAIIGDHRQLPPVVSSSAARAGGLNRSLFERLMDKQERVKTAKSDGEQVEDEIGEAEDTLIPSTMLNVQHRMHPSLSKFPNQTFYEGVLENGGGTALLPPLQTGFSYKVADPYTAFLTHQVPEERVDNSLQNSFEARAACDVVASLLLRNPTLRGLDIGIVTPYVAQVLLLSRMLRADLGSGMRERMDAALAKMDGEARKAVQEQLKAANTTVAERAKEAVDVEVHTVDGFEGREKAAIVFSTVRTNASGYVGFLADGRRLNVALTRAQRGLFLLGNLTTWERAKLGEVGDREMERSDVGLLKTFAAHLKEAGVVLPMRREHDFVL